MVVSKGTEVYDSDVCGRRGVGVMGEERGGGLGRGGGWGGGGGG